MAKKLPAAKSDWCGAHLAALGAKEDKTDLEKKALATVGLMSDASKDWMYMDFVDPKTGWPCLPFEALFGARGLLLGRTYYVNAGSSIGKSSLCYLLYGMGQYGADARCVHAESEHADHPPDFVASYGCDPHRILVCHPGSIDAAFTEGYLHCHGVRRTKFAMKDDPEALKPVLFGLDSISGFASGEIEKDEMLGDGDKSLGAHARAVSKFYREHGAAQLAKERIIMIIVAQTKAKIMTDTPGYIQSRMQQKDKETTIAENALMFAATTRVRMTGKEYREEKQVLGTIVTMETTKNKLNRGNRSLDVLLLRNEGFDLTGASYDYLKGALGAKGGTKLTGGTYAGQTFEVSTAGGMIDCPLVLGDRKIKTTREGIKEFVGLFYDNDPLLMSIRETLFIRGFGFAFETDYEIIGRLESEPD